jgi:hypothetical protein
MYGGTWPPPPTEPLTRTDYEIPLDGADHLIDAPPALYVGYNGNHQNFDLLTSPAGTELLRSRSFLNDARPFFAKFSYLVRF